jgi:hypothetical protein
MKDLQRPYQPFLNLSKKCEKQNEEEQCQILKNHPYKALPRFIALKRRLRRSPIMSSIMRSLPGRWLISVNHRSISVVVIAKRDVSLDRILFLGSRWRRFVWRRTCASSIQKMEAEHRRYFRYQLTLDAEVILRDGSAVAAQILNVSDGGFAMRLLDRALFLERNR